MERIVLVRPGVALLDGLREGRGELYSLPRGPPCSRYLVRPGVVLLDGLREGSYTPSPEVRRAPVSSAGAGARQADPGQSPTSLS
jgi:hypothetical protein